MSRSKVVDTLDFHTHVTIREYEFDKGIEWRFDWVTNTGQESDYMFRSLDEARDNAKDHFA